MKEIKASADTVKATVEAIKAWQDLLTSKRSVVLEVGNGTNRTLTTTSNDHEFGGFAKLPAVSIPPMKNDVLGSQSTGFAQARKGASPTAPTTAPRSLCIGTAPSSATTAAMPSGTGLMRQVLGFKLRGSGNHGVNMRYLLVKRPVADFTAHPTTGNPVLIQSRFGTKGNFEVLTPLGQGGMASYFRDNDNSAFPWHRLITFGAGPFDAVSMIQSNFGDPGNLEVVARVGQRLAFAFRDGLDWKGPFVM